MAKESQTETENVLIMPWNRLPNYLICVVALVNLVVGVVAVRIAIGFALDIADFNDVVATVSIGLFGLMLVWVAWCFRRGLLPVRFVADARRRECGFRWGPWWNGRFDLADSTKLIGEIRSHKDKWRWAILLPAGSSGERDRWIYGSGESFVAKRDSETECEKIVGQLAAHLALPFEVRTRSGGSG